MMFIFFLSVLLLFGVNVNSDSAFVLIDGADITIGNDLFNATFGTDAIAKYVYKNNINLVAHVSLKTWYFDWVGGKGGFHPDTVAILSNSSELAHVAFKQNASEGLLDMEFHMIVLHNVSGIYQYIKASNPTNISMNYAEIRTVYRFDHKLMPKVSNMVRSGETPDVSNRPTIQDTTWQLEDGSYWSKYDFCGYIRETPWFGVYGGGFGGWIISPSREYHSAGPLKQELLVHQDSLMLNYFTSSHFGTPNLEASPGFSKFYGPYLVYLNTGSEEEVQEDVAKQALIEQQQWPYKWVDEEEYPLSRGSVSGKVTGQTKAMVVVYDAVDQEFDLQTTGYLYFSETDANGTFTIKNIRPGNYQIVAYPLAGQGSDNLARKNITVADKGMQDIGTLDLPEPTSIIWSLGETNRRSDSYRYSDELRNFYWHLLPPANLTFQVGKSRIDQDWYYAQTRSPGVWKITYLDEADGNDRVLRVAFAAASSSASIAIYVNGKQLGHFAYSNDATVYRDALQSGNFHSEKILVPSSSVVDGYNVVEFELIRGMFMYDAISLARV